MLPNMTKSICRSALNARQNNEEVFHILKDGKVKAINSANLDSFTYSLDNYGDCRKIKNEDEFYKIMSVSHHCSKSFDGLNINILLAVSKRTLDYAKIAECVYFLDTDNIEEIVSQIVAIKNNIVGIVDVGNAVIQDQDDFYLINTDEEFTHDFKEKDEFIPLGFKVKISYEFLKNYIAKNTMNNESFKPFMDVYIRKLI